MFLNCCGKFDECDSAYVEYRREILYTSVFFVIFKTRACKSALTDLKRKAMPNVLHT